MNSSGFRSGVLLETPFAFYRDSSHNPFRPAGELNVNVVNDKGVEVPLQVNDNEDGSFLIDYVPASSGVHILNCTYGGVKVPDTPIKINVQSPVDLSKVKVEGLETRKSFGNLSVFSSTRWLLGT